MRSSDIRSVRLPKKRRGILGFASEGFVVDQIDGFLAQCADALEAWEKGEGVPLLRGDDVVVKQFAHTRIGEAYDPDAVDDYLDEVVLELRRHEQAAAAR